MHKKVLVIGSGSIANKHIKILKKNNYKVFVYSKNKNFKNINSKVTLLKNFDFLPKVDFAVIANETYKHLEFIKILAKKIINRRLIKFKESNQQLNLIEKNLKMMNFRIRDKDFSIKYFDDSLKDLMVCLKMHLSKHT